MTDRVFGKYRIVEKIGAGGFGDVYMGLDPMLNRHVAIKTCSSRAEDLRKRFLREAEIAARLQHPNIVTVFDFGYEGETPYLVQEYLDGEDLDHKIDRSDSIDLETRIDYLSKTASGLLYAHSQNVVHRDVKPSNVRVLGDGQVKVMDFGIAKLLTAETQLTQTGMTMGTAAYLPPEQLLGRDLDPRADLFSFGVLAYELLVGERPFAGESLSAVLYAIAHTEPTPVANRCFGCPPRLAKVIETCLAKEPEARYPGFGEVIAELDAVAAALTSGGSALVPPSVPPAVPQAAESTTIPLARGIADSSTARKEKTDRFVRRLWVGLIAAGLLGAVGLGALWIARSFIELEESAPAAAELAVPAGEAPVEEEPIEEEPIEEVPVEEVPVEEVPVEEVPVEDVPVEDVPGESMVLEEAAAGDPSATQRIAENVVDEPELLSEEPVAEPPPRIAPVVETASERLPATPDPEPEGDAETELAADEPVPDSAASVPAGPLILNMTSGLKPGRLGIGERVYADSEFVFQQVPEIYRGLPSVLTENGQKRSKDWISFRVSRPVEVFVAYDTRITRKPTWLESFHPAGETLTVDDGAEESHLVTYQIYSKRYGAGAVSLGENVVPRLRRKRFFSMYAVFLRPE